MRIQKVKEGKKRFLPLLLLGDEQESMIDRYLEQGELYVAFEGEAPIAVCVVTEERPGLWEIKNLATAPAHQNQGYATALLQHVFSLCKPAGGMVMLGTGETPKILDFYRKRGFRESHRIENFFTDHYDHPIVEEGITLKDMVYLTRKC